MAEIVEGNKNMLKIIVFKLLDEEYGLDVQQVHSIERMQHITRVHDTPAYVRGVINLRGVIHPIIDLRTRFNLPQADYTESTRIIIVSVQEMEVGLIVDEANDVLDVSYSQIEPPPEVVGGIEAKYIRGVVKLAHRLCTLLDLEEVLSREELNQKETIEG